MNWNCSWRSDCFSQSQPTENFFHWLSNAIGKHHFLGVSPLEKRRSKAYFSTIVLQSLSDTLEEIDCRPGTKTHVSACSSLWRPECNKARIHLHPTAKCHTLTLICYVSIPLFIPVLCDTVLSSNNSSGNQLHSMPDMHLQQSQQQSLSKAIMYHQDTYACLLAQYRTSRKRLSICV